MSPGSGFGSGSFGALSKNGPDSVNEQQPKPAKVPPPVAHVDDSGGPAARGLTPGNIDPRSGLDRRNLRPASDTGLERRRGPGRRRTDFTKAAEEGEMNKEQFLFLVAIDAFKKANAKTFPSWTDVLEVMRLLGYRKTCASVLNLPIAEDWTEKSDAPHGVREVTGAREDDEE